MKSHWTRVAAESNNSFPYNTQEMQTDTQGRRPCEDRQRLEWCFYKPRGSQECWRPPRARKGRGRIPPSLGGSVALLILWFWVSGLRHCETINFYCPKPLRFVVICYGSSGKQLQARCWLLCERKYILPLRWGPALQQVKAAPLTAVLGLPASLSATKPVGGIWEAMFTEHLQKHRLAESASRKLMQSFRIRPPKRRCQSTGSFNQYLLFGSCQGWGPRHLPQHSIFQTAFKFLKGHLPPQNFIHGWYL